MDTESEIKITQREVVKTKAGSMSVVVFNTGTCILGFDNAGASINMHISKEELYALGDAIQRIIAGEDRYSETKDDQS